MSGSGIRMGSRSAVISGMVFSIALAAGIAWIFIPRGSREPAAELSFSSPRLTDFRLLERYPTRDSTVAVLASGDSHLRVEEIHLDKDSAKILLEEEIFSIEALYANALSPYPGDLSKEIAFNEQFKPRFFEKTRRGVTYSYFLLYSNARFGLGVGSKDAVKYKAILGFFFCDQRQLFFKVKVFAPLGRDDQELEDLFLSLSCRE